MGTESGLLRTFLLCNDARWGKHGIIGDPTEAAFLLYADKNARNGEKQSEQIRDAWKRIAERPFDSERKCMTTVHQNGMRTVSFTKGAPDMILGIAPPTETRWEFIRWEYRNEHGT